MTETSPKSNLVRLITNAIQNVDTILSIVLALVAAGISLFGGKTDFAIAATAGALTLISISILRDRNAREQLLTLVHDVRFDLSQLLRQTPADKFFSKKTSEQGIISNGVNEIVIIQETGRLIAETHRREIVNFLNNGGHVRWISVMQTPMLTELMAFRNANLSSPQIMATRMNSGIEMIELLAKEVNISASNFVLRFLPYPVDITAIFRDPYNLNERQRECLIRLQGFRLTYDDKLDFYINGLSSKETFELYRRQMESMWRSCTKCILLTGEPAIGKTTLLEKVVNQLQQSTALKIDGFITHDVRNEAGDRIGFEAKTLKDKRSGVLALKKGDGSYELNQETMNHIIKPVLEEGIASAELLVIDEIGPIQLQDEEFSNTINRALNKQNLSIIGTVALKGHPYLQKIRQHYRTEIVNVTELNREQLVKDLVNEFLDRKL